MVNEDTILILYITMATEILPVLKRLFVMDCLSVNVAVSLRLFLEQLDFDVLTRLLTYKIIEVLDFETLDC